MTAMVDLAKTPAEVKEEVKAMTMPAMAMPDRPKVPEYPYGLCISMEDETLEKLKLDGDLPAVGEMIHFMTTAKVTNASMRESVGDDGKTKKCCRIELQITEIGLVGPTPDRAEKWYGNKDGDEADDD